MLAQIKKLGLLLPVLFLSALPAHAQLGTVQGFCDNGGNHSLTSGQPSSNYLQGNIPLCTVSVFYHDTTTLAPIFMGESSTGTLQSVQVTTGGSYSVCPTGVTFTGGGGSGATATVSCTAGAVVSVAVTSQGSGYTTAPTVAFTGGTGSGAAATATIVGDLTNPFTANIDGSWRLWAAIATGYDITMSGGIPPNSYAQPRTITNIFPNAFGGTSYTIVQANGTASAPVSPVNFINSSTVNFSITGNQISATVNAGTVLALQHNSANLADQSLLNFCDNGSCGGAVDTGYQPVLWKPDITGGLSGETLQGLGVTNFSSPPLNGQSAIIYPTSSTVSLCGGGAYGTGASTNTSGYVYQSLGGAGDCISSVTWNFSAPGGSVTTSSGATIPVANITAVYPFIFNSLNVVTTGGNTSGDLNCTGTGLTFPGYLGYIHPSFSHKEFIATTSLSPVTTANINAMSCTADVGQVDGLVSPPNNANNAVTLIGAYVYYTGTPVTAPNNVNVIYPLVYTGYNQQLSLQLPFNYAPDVGTANTYVVTNSAFSVYTSGLMLSFCPANSNTGASTLNLNGQGAWPILNWATGLAIGANALQPCSPTVSPATLILGNTDSGNYTWFLESSSSGSLSGMTAGQVPIAATPTTVTSSKALAGTGVGIATGPTTTTLNDCVKFGDTAGTLADAGAACGSGAGSLPTATYPGQIIASTAAGTTYAAQPQIFYSQTGDTIASIESECGSTPCEYIVNQNQTFTLAANHTLAANIQVKFVGGVWTVNGATFTLTFGNTVTGGVSKYINTAGTAAIKFAPGPQQIYAEWFGAVGDCGGAAGTTCTTDNHVAFQAAINSLSAGNTLVLLPVGYGMGTTTLTWTSSSTNMMGVADGHSGTLGITNFSYIVNDSSTATILDVGDTATVQYNHFGDFSVERSVGPTATAKGISFINAQGIIAEHIQSSDSVEDFYFTGAPAYGNGIYSDLQATFGYVSGCYTGTAYGFYVDGATVALNSMRGARWTVADRCTGNSVALYLNQTTDFVLNGLEAGVTQYGIEATGSMTDAHVTGAILDQLRCSAVYSNAVTGTSYGSLSIGVQWMLGSASACPAIDIESSQGVTVSGETGGGQVGGKWTGEVGIINGGWGNAITGMAADGAVFGGAGNCWKINNSTHNRLENNSCTIASGGFGVTLTSSASYNAISGNTFPNSTTCPVFNADATSNHNHYLNTNTTACATPYNDLGTDNQSVGTGNTTANFNGGSAIATLPMNGNIPLKCADTSLSGTAQSCSTSPSFTLASGNCLTYTTTTANTGTGLTIAINGGAATSVAIPGSSGWTTTLTAGIIPANKPLQVCYDGTNLNVQQTGTASSGGGSGNYVDLCGTVTFTPSAGTGSCSGGVYTTTAAAASITISAIPTTYKTLIVSVYGGATTDGDVDVQFNSDATAGNYSCWRTFTNTSGVLNSGCSVVSPNGYLGATLVATSATLSSGGEFRVISANSSGGKAVIGAGYDLNNPGGAAFQGNYAGSAPISQMQIINKGGTNFNAGLRITIDGTN